ncbi:hypothetical protein FACS1894200_01390 [Spirochaetia bacterium]|nr:hypothetical protein FACS1894200_01390 [Spirochaetia bacterium]
MTIQKTSENQISYRIAMDVPRECRTRNEVEGNEALDETLIDAICRYKAVNNNAGFDLVRAEPFLQALGTTLGELCPFTEPRMTFYEDAVKVRLNVKGGEFVIDYNFEEPQMVFILSRREGKLVVKDCGLADIPKTLELF